MILEKIKSIKDEKVLFARNLQRKSERIKTRSFLVEGEQAINWAYKSNCTLKYLFVHDRYDGEVNWNIQKFSCSDGILKKITETKYLIPLVAVAELPPKDVSLSSELLVVFDGVQDFGNIGTIIRTASAFGVDEVVSTADDFDLQQRKTVDASRGAVFSSQLTTFPNPEVAVKTLKANGYQIVVTALEGSTIQSLTELEARPIAVVFGNESNGASKEMLELADLKIQIPMATDMDSLNVGVAAGISLYELKLKGIMMTLNEKIRGSFGRNLSCSSTWLRKLFDLKLKEVSDLDAEQAILLMMLSCEERGEFYDEDLVTSGYLLDEGNGFVKITEKGKELIGKIWSVHEFTENAALKGFTKEERQAFSDYLQRIQKNLNALIPFE